MAENTLRNWCRCSPLPPVSEPWKCGTCGGERRYTEKIAIGAGGIVARCGQCRADARRTGASVPNTLCRHVTVTTQLAGEIREVNSYWLCDAHCDEEIAGTSTADIIDGRQQAVTG